MLALLWLLVTSLLLCTHKVELSSSWVVASHLACWQARRREVMRQQRIEEEAETDAAEQEYQVWSAIAMLSHSCSSGFCFLVSFYLVYGQPVLDKHSAALS